MFRFILFLNLSSIALISLAGCSTKSAPVISTSPTGASPTGSQPLQPVAGPPLQAGASPHPEIFIVNRANPQESAVTPNFHKGVQLNFPAIDARGGNYWVIFVDKTPCAPSQEDHRNTGSRQNQKAYLGTPTTPAHCVVNIDPEGGRDTHFRYALWVDTVQHKVGPPPIELPYRLVHCNPICN